MRHLRNIGAIVFIFALLISALAVFGKADAAALLLVPIGIPLAVGLCIWLTLLGVKRRNYLLKKRNSGDGVTLATTLVVVGVPITGIIFLSAIWGLFTGLRRGPQDMLELESAILESMRNGKLSIVRLQSEAFLSSVEDKKIIVADLIERGMVEVVDKDSLRLSP